VKRRSSAVAVEAQDVRTPADDDGVLTFVNAKLRKITNYGRFQWFS
jgi:hypothetical protein